MSLNAPLKIFRLVRVPFLLFRAYVTSITLTVVGIILHHSTLILINSRRKALKFPEITLCKTQHRRRTNPELKTTRFETLHQTKWVKGRLERDSDNQFLFVGNFVRIKRNDRIVQHFNKEQKRNLQSHV